MHRRTICGVGECVMCHNSVRERSLTERCITKLLDEYRCLWDWWSHASMHAYPPCHFGVRVETAEKRSLFLSAADMRTNVCIDGFNLYYRA